MPCIVVYLSARHLKNWMSFERVTAAALLVYAFFLKYIYTYEEKKTLLRKNTWSCLFQVLVRYAEFLRFLFHFNSYKWESLLYLYIYILIGLQVVFKIYSVQLISNCIYYYACNIVVHLFVICNYLHVFTIELLAFLIGANFVLLACTRDIISTHSVTSCSCSVLIVSSSCILKTCSAVNLASIHGIV